MYMFFFTIFCCLKFDSWSVYPCTNVSMFHQIRFTHIELIPQQIKEWRVLSPSRCPLPGHLGPAERLSATLYTHYICTWNNFETRMELQIARVSLKWRYIDIDRISAPLKDIHCITQVAWSHDEDMLFDTNCSSFLIRTSSKSENPSLSEQRQRKIRKKHNIHYRDIYGCNIRLFSLQSNVHVCQYQISKS